MIRFSILVQYYVKTISVHFKDFNQDLLEIDMNT